MSRKLLMALVLIALTVVVLLLNNSGSITLDLGITDLKLATAMALLSFTSIGVVIGLLLR
jgi:hypothetical protein